MIDLIFFVLGFPSNLVDIMTAGVVYGFVKSGVICLVGGQVDANIKENIKM